VPKELGKNCMRTSSPDLGYKVHFTQDTTNLTMSHMYNGPTFSKDIVSRYVNRRFAVFIKNFHMYNDIKITFQRLNKSHLPQGRDLNINSPSTPDIA
jgi:hypothetical protein